MDIFGMMGMLRNMGKMQNPEQIAMSMLRQQAGNNQFANNAVDMLGQNNFSGLEEMARKIGKTKGTDVDAIMAQVKNTMGYK